MLTTRDLAFHFHIPLINHGLIGDIKNNPRLKTPVYWIRLEAKRSKLNDGQFVETGPIWTTKRHERTLPGHELVHYGSAITVFQCSKNWELHR